MSARYARSVTEGTEGPRASAHTEIETAREDKERLGRKEAENTETISHRDTQRTECLSGGGSGPAGRNMDRETLGFTSATHFPCTCEPSVSRSMPRVARPHRLADVN